MEKLIEVISFLLRNSKDGRSRQELAKLVYYCDGVFYQRSGTIITGQRYIHSDDCPLPVQLHEALLSLKEKEMIDVLPKITDRGVTSFRLVYTAASSTDENLEKKERRILKKVLENFRAVVADENRIYPNLYENYVITPLYGEIKFSVDTINTKVHFFKRKKLLNISGKIFRVLFNE